MFNIGISHLVTHIVEHAFRDQKGDPNAHRNLQKGYDTDALYIHFDVSMAHYHNGGEYSQRKGLHLLYQRDPGYSYITVFTGVTESPFAKIKEVEWKYITHHDSCWKDVSTFSEVYFDMAKKVNEMLVKDGLPEIAPRDMTEHNFLPLFGADLYKWVKIHMKKDPTDERNYRRLVTILEG